MDRAATNGVGRDVAASAISTPVRPLVSRAALIAKLRRERFHLEPSGACETEEERELDVAYRRGHNACSEALELWLTDVDTAKVERVELDTSGIERGLAELRDAEVIVPLPRHWLAELDAKEGR